MSLKILIVDDDERERIVLRYIIEQMEDVTIIGEASNGIEAVLMVKEKKPDLVFLDITMPDMDGLDTARQLKELPQPPFFAFVTLRSDKAVDAFALDALDYIVKPMAPNRIRETIDRANRRLLVDKQTDMLVERKVWEKLNSLVNNLCYENSLHNRLPIKQKGKVVLLKQDDILYAESRKKKVFVCTSNEEYATGYTLNELEHLLDQAKFLRVHQAFIVNLDHILEISAFGEGSYQIVLDNTLKQITLSRSRAKELRNKLNI